jgi:hypothetical protein
MVEHDSRLLVLGLPSETSILYLLHYLPSSYLSPIGGNDANEPTCLGEGYGSCWSKDVQQRGSQLSLRVQDQSEHQYYTH